MPSPVEVPYVPLEELAARIAKLLYPPHRDLPPEQVERHYRHITQANTWNPALLIEDVNELLDELEKFRSERDAA